MRSGWIRLIGVTCVNRMMMVSGVRSEDADQTQNRERRDEAAKEGRASVGEHAHAGQSSPEDVYGQP